MNLTWKQLVLCGAAVVLTGAIGYHYWVKGGSQEDASGNTSETEPNGVIKKKKRQKKVTKPAKVVAKEPPKESPQNHHESLPDGLEEMIRDCDLPIPELLKLSQEHKQRVFYGLLMKGEMMLHKGPEELNQAIDYFSKAVAIVPNPGEVVAAFEKTLPPPVFNALLDRIQRDVQSKVGEYFGGLLTSGKAKFVEMDTSGESGGLAKWWYPVAAVDMQIGGILWEEDADVVALVQSVEDRDDHCEHCLTLMEQDNRISCPACDCALYCSQSCQIKSSEAYHTFFCQPPEEVKAAMGQLLALCQENQSSLALLVLRYVAFLLSEELRGNGAANCGPFAHYDHLKPVFRGPNDMDRAEARLLRKIFSSTNQNIVEFLSDEIYTSMKATIARVLFTGGAISALTRHETRTLIDSSPTVSFFHISAHLGHSCDPNVVLLRDKASHARVVATKTIKKGERLITSYLAFPEGTCTAERQLHLMRIFGIHCQCVLCTDDLPSIA